MSWTPRELARSVYRASTIAAGWRATPFTTPVEAVAFWTAVCLPAVYLPLLVLGRRSTIGPLLALHAITLALGHPYKRDRNVED